MQDDEDATDEQLSRKINQRAVETAVKRDLQLERAEGRTRQYARSISNCLSLTPLTPTVLASRYHVVATESANSARATRPVKPYNSVRATGR